MARRPSTYSPYCPASSKNSSNLPGVFWFSQESRTSCDHRSGTRHIAHAHAAPGAVPGLGGLGLVVRQGGTLRPSHTLPALSPSSRKSGGGHHHLRKPLGRPLRRLRRLHPVSRLPFLVTSEHPSLPGRPPRIRSRGGRGLAASAPAHPQSRPARPLGRAGARPPPHPPQHQHPTRRRGSPVPTSLKP